MHIARVGERLPRLQIQFRISRSFRPRNLVNLGSKIRFWIRRKEHTLMTFAAITTLPKTTHNISALNAGETSSNYSVKRSLSPHKSSHGTFLHSLTVDLFKIPDINQRLIRRHTVPAFKTIVCFSLFVQVFGLVRNQHEFPSRRLDFNPRSYFVRPKTCYCQHQSSQYPIFLSQARDQSFTHVARNETKYENI